MQSRYPTFSMIVSFLQKFCADQSPTSYVVEVQSQAENDWLVTLSKNCPMKSHNIFLFLLEFVHCFRCFRTPFFLFLYSPEPVSTAKICLRSFEEQTKRIRIRRYEKASKSHLS